MQTKIITFFTIALFACNGNEKSSSTPETATAVTPAENTMKVGNTSGYSLLYDTKWALDNPANAEKVLSMYKNWDDNNWTNSKQHMADSVSVITWDGTVMQGTKDEVTKNLTDYRGNYTNVKSVIHGLVGIKAVDKNEDWVLIYAREIHTDKRGKTDSTELQEAWCFNKEGKLMRFYQYGQLKPATAPK